MFEAPVNFEILLENSLIINITLSNITNSVLSTSDVSSYVTKFATCSIKKTNNLKLVSANLYFFTK